MKKVLFVLMLLFSMSTMAQKLSVLGIEMGTSIEYGERILKTRFGEFNVYRKGTVELSTYYANIGGDEWHFVSFEYQNKYSSERVYSYLSRISFSSNFSDRGDAQRRFDYWKNLLLNKYTYFFDEKNNENDYTVFYKEGIWLNINYGKSNGGDYFWYVTITYHEDFVDESNDY